PFEYWKGAELAGAEVTVPAGGRRSEAEERRALLLASLWGNQADLGFLFGATGPLDAPGGLVADAGPRRWAARETGGPHHVGIVTDNAGRELLADLVLVDHLLRTGLAGAVTLHLKPRPYYVSDATTADLVACLRRLAAAGEEAAAV